MKIMILTLACSVLVGTFNAAAASELSDFYGVYHQGSHDPILCDSSLEHFQQVAVNWDAQKNAMRVALVGLDDRETLIRLGEGSVPNEELPEGFASGQFKGELKDNMLFSTVFYHTPDFFHRTGVAWILLSLERNGDLNLKISDPHYYGVMAHCLFTRSPRSVAYME